jgi:hypothetical protein
MQCLPGILGVDSQHHKNKQKRYFLKKESDIGDFNLKWDSQGRSPEKIFNIGIYLKNLELKGSTN